MSSPRERDNPYCRVLGIEVPSLEQAARHPDANHYALLIVALLERGAPLTLAEVAERFEQAGLAPAAIALASLKRCKPGRPPVHRHGDHYALDPHDDETDLWAFRLGLRPAKRPRPTPARVESPPLPPPEHRLTIAELTEAWRHGFPSGLSTTRAVISVLDAHDCAMRPDEIEAFLRARSKRALDRNDRAQLIRRGSPIRVRADGLWELVASHASVVPARAALRARLVQVGRWAAAGMDPEIVRARALEVEQERAAHAARLERLSRVIVHAYPVDEPVVVVLLDIARRELTSFRDDQCRQVRDLLGSHDVIAGLDVRPTIAAIGFDPGDRRLVELGPPQKSIDIDGSGRSLKITNEMLIRSSCRIRRPLGDSAALRRLYERGDRKKLWLRLEADARSLYAYHEYGMLHHAVRLRWGFLETMLPVSWAHRDEESLGSMKSRAYEQSRPLEVVVGPAPGWTEPWARGESSRVLRQRDGWRLFIVRGDGSLLAEGDVQRARIAHGVGSASRVRERTRG